MTTLTNGDQTFAVVDGKDKNGAGYSPCALGASCEHPSAPEGATVWHDAEHTEELWEVAGKPGDMKTYKIEAKTQDIFVQVAEIMAPSKAAAIRRYKDKSACAGNSLPSWTSYRASVSR